MLGLSLPRSGVIAGRKIKQLLKSIIGDIKFSDFKLPFACVATDIISGEEIVINQGSVLEAVRASFSMPIIFTVVKRNGRYLVDGGLVNPVPVSVLKNMGADFIIAVNVMPRLNKQLEPVYLEIPAAGEKSATKEPNIFNIMLNIFSIINEQVVNNSLSGADIIIEPHLPNTGLGDFSHADKCILQGGLSTIDALIEIKRQLAA